MAFVRFDLQRGVRRRPDSKQKSPWI
ncbi:uncharacterized protein G2W53_023273 [Senna tora]|uniref:Uncharacterized protein n=1 Tax=Senna tora TaxID=362788 RepID=A0A834WEC0_9FABA|nr:uncharacterized protein G2W53_023273 [Senna tora]